MEPKMSVNLSIKNAPDEVVAALKLRAQQNHRSLQGELMAIIEAAARETGQSTVQGLRENAASWTARDEAIAVKEAKEAKEARERDIERVVALMRKGLPLGGRRFTRDEMHER
jgi:plasmid stability protein